MPSTDSGLMLRQKTQYTASVAIFREALIQGRAYLDNVRGGYPDDARQWGWTLQTLRHNDGAGSDEWKTVAGRMNARLGR